MAVLSWGKPKIEIVALENGEIPANPNWNEITLSIKEGTTTLTTEAGNKTEALDEAGEVVDSRTAKSKYSLTFSLFMSKGASKPIEDVDGIITTNYAIRLTPEDSAAMGFVLKKCNVTVQESWSAADGGLWVYTFNALKPTTGKMLERWSGIVLTASKTAIAKAGETITIAADTSASTITAASSPTGPTCTVASKVVSVQVPQNTASTEKTFTITVTDSNGASATVVLTQAGA